MRLFKLQEDAYQNRFNYRIRIFLLIATGYVFSSPFAPYALSPIFKVLPIIVLGTLVWSLMTGKVRILTLLALVFSGLGDVFLALQFESQFMFGLGSFLIAHFFYAAVFFQLRNSTMKLFKGVFIVIILFYGVATFKTINPYTGDLTSAVLIYMLVIMLTCFCATLAARPKHGLLPTGMLVFMVSDTLIAWHKFVFPIWLSDVWIMLSYYLAQMLIVCALIKLTTNINPLVTNSNNL